MSEQHASGGAPSVAARVDALAVLRRAVSAVEDAARAATSSTYPAGFTNAERLRFIKVRDDVEQLLHDLDMSGSARQDEA